MANQYETDPRQALFLTYYLDINSKTFSNALQSALKAGYSQEYSENITAQMPDWLLENLGKKKRLARAEKVLDEMLDMPVQTLEWEGRGEDAEQVVVTNPALVKTKQDTAKFIAERLGKNDYSIRNEVSGKNGEAITVSIVQYGNSNNNSAQLLTEGLSVGVPVSTPEIQDSSLESSSGEKQDSSQ